MKTLVFLHVGFLICEMGQPGFLLPGGALCQLCVQLRVVKPHFLWDPEVKGTGQAPGMMYSPCVLTVSTCPPLNIPPEPSFLVLSQSLIS